MKATEAKLLDFLKKSPQFVIPIYQRTYSWTEQECRQLWDDILRTGTNSAVLCRRRAGQAKGLRTGIDDVGRIRNAQAVGERDTISRHREVHNCAHFRQRLSLAAVLLCLGGVPIRLALFDIVNEDDGLGV
jgi:hypothetical protein